MSNLDVSTDEQARFNRFTCNLDERGRSANTQRAYRMDWQSFAAWFALANGEAFDLAHLTVLDVQDYVSWSKRENFKPATINRRLGFLKQYARWGEEQNILSADQFKRIKQIAVVKKQTLAPQALTIQEVRKLLRELEIRGNIRDRAILYTLLYTGLRVGELVALTLEDLRLSERKGAITVRAAVAKGGKERIVPVPQSAREVLTAYFANTKLNNRIFVGRQGPLSEAGVAAIVNRYSQWANLKSVTPHTLRHTFAYTFLLHNSNDLVALADILGHSSLDTTQIYTKRRLEDLQTGVEQIKFF